MADRIACPRSLWRRCRTNFVIFGLINQLLGLVIMFASGPPVTVKLKTVERKVRKAAVGLVLSGIKVDGHRRAAGKITAELLHR